MSGNRRNRKEKKKAKRKKGRVKRVLAAKEKKKGIVKDKFVRWLGKVQRMHIFIPSVKSHRTPRLGLELVSSDVFPGLCGWGCQAIKSERG